MKKLRLSIFRSNKHIYGQIIDDEKGNTLTSASDLELKIKKEDKTTTKKEIAQKVGQLIAQKALKKKIKKIIFDRGKYKFHGRVKTLAEGAREKGLEF